MTMNKQQIQRALLKPVRAFVLAKVSADPDADRQWVEIKKSTLILDISKEDEGTIYEAELNDDGLFIG